MRIKCKGKYSHRHTFNDCIIVVQVSWIDDTKFEITKLVHLKRISLLWIESKSSHIIPIAKPPNYKTSWELSHETGEQLFY